MRHLWLGARATLWYILAAIICVPWMIVLYLCWPLPFIVRAKVLASWSRVIHYLTVIVCGITYRIEGREHLLQDQAVIYFSKHQSAWETIIFPGIFPKHCYLLKKELLNIPIWGWGLRTAKPIAIDRSQNLRAFKQVIKEGKSRIKEGISIILFPEGTRVAPTAHPKFHKSGAALAKATGALVVPVAHNAGNFWRKNSFLKYPGCITIKIGPPINTEELSVDALNEKTYEWMCQSMKTLGKNCRSI